MTKKILLFIFSISLMICCKPIMASSLFFENSSQEIRVGDTFVVDVKLSSEKENINVADGSLSFDKNILNVNSISTGNSIFTLWTRSPIFSNESGKIMFTGGVPNGISTERGQIIKIIFFAKAIGSSTLVFLDESSLYLNDGKGTIIKPKTKSINILVSDSSGKDESKNEWENILAIDKSMPNIINIKLGKDQSMFDNQFFISFYGVDKDSGIKSYEIKEGDGNFIESESPYVLKDQSLKSLIFIKAIDNANNYKIIKFNPESEQKSISTRLYIFIILGLGIIVLIYLKLRNKNAKK